MAGIRLMLKASEFFRGFSLVWPWGEGRRSQDGFHLWEMRGSSRPDFGRIPVVSSLANLLPA